MENIGHTVLNLSFAERTEILAGFGVKGVLADWELSVNLSQFWLVNTKTFISNGYTNGINDGAGIYTDAYFSAETGELTRQQYFFNAILLTVLLVRT